MKTALEMRELSRQSTGQITLNKQLAKIMSDIERDASSKKSKRHVSYAERLPYDLEHDVFEALRSAGYYVGFLETFNLVHERSDVTGWTVSW